MPTSAVATAAAETRALNDWRKTQGLPDVFGGAATREKNALKAAGQWPPGKTPRKRKAAAATSTSTSGTAAPAPPASPVSATGVPAGVGSIAAKLAGLGQTAAAAPDPDPVAEQLAKTMQLVQPTWELDSGFLHIEAPGVLKPVSLPVEAKPGPYTPTEEIHDILGQPDLLYQVALGFAEGLNVLVMGPTGVAKTVVFRWFAKKLNWNIVTCQIHGGTAPEDLVGEFLPVEQTGGKGVGQMIKFIYAVVAKAALASQRHPTICVLEEVNRIGNQQAFAKIYSLLDDTRQIEIPNKEDDDGLSEVIVPGKLYFGANMNPADVGYVGTQVLDVAFGRRFPAWHEVGYPPEEIEAEALRRRVKGLKLEDAKKMIAMATLVRRDEDITYPVSFPDLAAWAKMLPYLGWDKAAESAVVAKAEPDDKAGIRGLILLKPTTSTVAA